MLPEEYSKAITLAGRTKNVDLAAELFSDAIDASLRNACLYNALMSAYMYNGLIEKAVSVFEDLKQDFNCKPTIVTYNILLSVFGRFLLVDHMETVLQAIDDSYLSYTITTYNTAIAAYVTAWMWDKMERMYQSMVEGPIKPDTDTLLLMLRGYAYSSNLEKMEKTYDQIKEMVNDRQTPLIRTMIDAYTKSCHLDRVRKVEALMKLIPEDDYRACLNVRLIRMYAQEGLIEAMEGLISKAFQHNTVVTAVGVMRSIISSYFKSNEVDRLAGFIRQAENAGWRLCRSLYHCKMVMYGQQNRLEEMHGVLDEMENFRFGRTKKTFFILYKGYSNIGRRLEAETVIGMMWKHGYGNPEDACVSPRRLSTAGCPRDLSLAGEELLVGDYSFSSRGETERPRAKNCRQAIPSPLWGDGTSAGFVARGRRIAGRRFLLPTQGEGSRQRFQFASLHSAVDGKGYREVVLEAYNDIDD
ncbi:hypothetical protein B296_00050496 [Ensete ventricosum]|uniref:Pentacotripeptide-repeat region of PRORP domain-containing protein n=1 Tax=Ensete ventricosum TaxID=4639 RepID=A0A426XAL0_ENSVE|nr:hypothetical protein B296_00050496 [Ensete ventricosum]